MLPSASRHAGLFSSAAQPANSGRTETRFPPTASFSLRQVSVFGQAGSVGRRRRITFGAAQGAAAHDGRAGQIADCAASATLDFNSVRLSMSPPNHGGNAREPLYRRGSGSHPTNLYLGSV